MSILIAYRIARWGQLVSEFAVNQGIAQAAGMISGLIYVRVMPVDQYALYAMGLSALGFLSVGSDLGLMGALGYYWRESKLANDGLTLGSMIAAIRKLRVVFLVISSAISALFLMKAAVSQDISLTSMFACFAVVVATAWISTRTTVDLLLFRLDGNFRQSYYCEAAGSVTRLAIASVMFATGIGIAVFGLFGGLLGSLATLITSRIVTNAIISSQEIISRETWRRIAAYIGPIFPNLVVYMVQDPLVLWLALTFGGQTVVSETFAIGRIAAVFGLLGSFIIIVVTPKLAGISDGVHFVRMAALSISALALLCAAATLIAFLFPQTLLLLIGPNYAHLQEQVVLSFAISSMGALSTFVVLVNRLRGWVRWEPATAALQLIAIVLLASQWSFQNSTSVLWLMLALACFNFLNVCVTSLVGVLMPAAVKAN